MGIISVIRDWLIDATDETIMILLSLMVLVLAIVVVFWIFNRRKFQKLSHQIPASVVKNYLDSIIQNSTALKSSLFRGGGLDLGEGMPSVVPASSLPTGNVGVSSEELAQKNAEIAKLKQDCDTKDKTIAELEAKLANAVSGGDAGAAEEITSLNAKVKDLEGQLAKAKQEAAAAAANAGAGGADPAALEAVTKERDEFKERLQEYEIIEEDLANLKRLQEENAQLKKQLEGLGAAPAAAAAPEPAPAPEAAAEPEVEAAPEPEEAVEEPAAEEDVAFDEPDEPAPAEEEAPVVEEEVEEVPENAGEQKSAEELLSEFEKMLG